MHCVGRISCLGPPFSILLLVPGVLVNDTIIGDPLFAVPLQLSEPVDFELGDNPPDRVLLCYEIHGRANQWFNLVTDECTSVNAHYINVTDYLNVINRIAVRAIDDNGACRQIAVDVNGCSIELDGMPLNLSRYSHDGIRIRKYPQRVRILVPNCAEQSLIMWITCESRDLEDRNTELLRFDVMRGLNLGHRDSHGLIGNLIFKLIAVMTSSRTWSVQVATELQRVAVKTLYVASNPGLPCFFPPLRKKNCVEGLGSSLRYM